MGFPKGTSGNPGGKPKDKPLTEALRIEATRLGNEERRRHPAGSWASLARAMLLRAANGDVAAFREIADRIEGRVPQAIVGSDDHPSVTGFREWLQWLSDDRVAEAMQRRVGQSHKTLEHVQSSPDVDKDVGSDSKD